MFRVKPIACKENGGTDAAVRLVWLDDIGIHAKSDKIYLHLQSWFQSVSHNTNNIV